MASSIPLAVLSPARNAPALDDGPARSDHLDLDPDIRPAWKRDLLALLEHPTSSPAAFLVHFSITSLIAFSALVTILETVPAFHSISGATWFGLESSLVALFTVEYVARSLAWSYSWPSLFAWLGSFFGIIDLLAILPYYVEIALQQDTSTLFRFSILRTFRLLRVFRPFRYNNTLLLTIEVMYLSFRRSQHALLALSFFVLMVLVVFSTLLYFIERGTWDDILETFINSDGDPSQFASIPAAAWFVIVTITTVGYGEITPRSFLGRLITIPLLVFGLLLIALPSFVLGREFSIVWNEMTQDEILPQAPQSPRLFSTALSPTLPHRRPRAPRPVSPPPASPRNAHAYAHAHATPHASDSDLAAQVAKLAAAIDAQGALLRALLDQREQCDAGAQHAAGPSARREKAA